MKQSKKINIRIESLLTIFLLFVVVLLAVWTRLGTMKSKTILDYDPWFFFRIAEKIKENNYKPLKWDIQSFFPPGRPFHPFLGWPYIMIVFYKIMCLFKPMVSFVFVAKISTVIMATLSGVSGFFLGKVLTNKWGGLATALFATLSPTFLGVSMAGYCDTDVVVVFFSYLCIFSIFLTMKKRKIQYYAFSIFSCILFIYSWWFGWYVLFFFTLFIPALIAFRILENIIQKKEIEIKKTIEDFKPIFTPLIIIIVLTNIIGYILGFRSMIHFFLTGLGFTGRTGGLLVNVSVAELQPINIFTKSGFLTVANRVGLGPMLLLVVGLPILVIYKIIKKTRINFSEIFLFMWAAITFYLILHGVRFSLLFSCAVAASAGYVIGNLVNIIKKDIIGSTAFGLLSLLILMFISNAVAYSNMASGMEVSQNWIDMLDWLKENADPKATVATWWDPGHIIAGYTGLRVHADGAHCPTGLCIPYPHNTRIQNMGRIMSTNDENEAVNILKKYMGLTDEQCQEVKKKYGNIVPEEACEPASEMYFIASSDLIGKFTWMNYFGGFRAPISSNQDFLKNPGVCCAATPKTEPGQMSCGEFANQGKGVWVWCPWIFTLSDVKQDQEGNPVYVYDYSGLKMTVIQKGNQLIPIYNNQFMINHLTFFIQGQEQSLDLSDLEVNLEKIDGLVWVDPGFKSLIYFAPSIKDSMFTRLFFYNGEGLKHFEQVYSNPEVRLYKVNFEA